jgi:hypothetical protein
MVNQPGVAGIRKAAHSAISFKEYFMKSRVLFVFALFIGAALSAQNAADFQYTVNNGTVTITGYTGSAKNVTIPERINNLPVTAIGDWVFADNQLISVTIPGSIIAIGTGVFSGNQLTSVTIPNSITAIGVRVFRENKLIGVTIPNSVTAIEESAFANNQLTSVTIPNSVTSIGDGAFQENQLTSITIGSSVTVIEVGAFAFNELTNVTIPGSVTTIGSGAFRFNPLTSVTIGANVNVTANPFTGNLTQVYTSGGKRAGTYRSRDSGKTWARQQ